MHRYTRTMTLILLSIILIALNAVSVFGTVTESVNSELEKALSLGFAYDWEIDPSDAPEMLNREHFVWITIRFLAMEYRVDTKTVVKIREYLPEAPSLDALGFRRFTDSTGEYDEVALLCGIIRGRGDGGYDPEALVTREEAASILYNTYRYYSRTTPGAGEDATYNDQDEIAEWARTPVQFCTSLDLLPGKDGSFLPHGTVTAEEAFVAFMRLYENAEYGRVHHNLENPFSYEVMEEMLHSMSAYHALYEEETEQYGVFYFYQDAPSANRRFWILYKDGGGIDLSMTFIETLGSWPTLRYFAWNKDSTKLACQHTANDGTPRIVQIDPEAGTVEVR